MSDQKRKLTSEELDAASGGIFFDEPTKLTCVGCDRTVEIYANEMVLQEYKYNKYVCPRCSAKPSEQWPNVKKARKD